MEFHPVPKPQHNRRVPKRKDRTNFSAKTIKDILERDLYQCVRCGSHHLESIPHHVIYRSQLGEGSKRNGVTICLECHKWAHLSKKHHNEWFSRWVDLNLDMDGNLKPGGPKNPDLVKGAF